MSFQQELSSWFAPPQLQVEPAPKPGEKAPSTDKLQIPAVKGKATLVTFLRHCGCPFAERTFRALRTTADENPAIHCVAISHSSADSTERWVNDVGGCGEVQVIVDEERGLYAKWGLGVSGWLHLANPGAFWNAYKLGKEKGIWNRPTESGSRWQTAGSYAVDEAGVVKWGGPAGRSDEETKFDEALSALRSRERVEAIVIKR